DKPTLDQLVFDSRFTGNWNAVSGTAYLIILTSDVFQVDSNDLSDRIIKSISFDDAGQFVMDTGSKDQTGKAGIYLGNLYFVYDGMNCRECAVSNKISYG